jgi:hypothetical protein
MELCFMGAGQQVSRSAGRDRNSKKADSDPDSDSENLADKHESLGGGPGHMDYCIDLFLSRQ